MTNRITPRQQQCYNLYSTTNLSRREIANSLGIAEGTLKLHLQGAFRNGFPRKVKSYHSKLNEIENFMKTIIPLIGDLDRRIFELGNKCLNKK